MRRVKPTMKPDQPERAYLYADMSERGQLRYYVQLRNKLPKIRLEAECGTPEFEAEVEAAIARRSYSMAMKATNEPASIGARRRLMHSATTISQRGR